MAVKLNKVKIVQYNLRHSSPTTANLYQRINTAQEALVNIIQGPSIIKSKITGFTKLAGRISARPPQINQELLSMHHVHIKTNYSHHYSSDLMVAKVEFFVMGKPIVIVLAIYLPQDAITLSPSR